MSVHEHSDGACRWVGSVSLHDKLILRSVFLDALSAVFALCAVVFIFCAGDNEFFRTGLQTYFIFFVISFFTVLCGVGAGLFVFSKKLHGKIGFLYELKDKTLKCTVIPANMSVASADDLLGLYDVINVKEDGFAAGGLIPGASAFKITLKKGMKIKSFGGGLIKLGGIFSLYFVSAGEDADGIIKTLKISI